MKFISKYIAYLKDNPEQYWFKRKLFGWGWTPVRWQGWVVLLISVGLIVLNVMRLEQLRTPIEEFTATLLLETGLIVGVLLIICYIKGEKPRWQWGFPKDEKERE